MKFNFHNFILNVKRCALILDPLEISIFLQENESKSIFHCNWTQLKTIIWRFFHLFYLFQFVLYLMLGSLNNLKSRFYFNRVYIDLIIRLFDIKFNCKWFYGTSTSTSTFSLHGKFCLFIFDKVQMFLIYSTEEKIA